MAENTASGTFTVAGKPIKITHAYAYAEKGFFDPKTDDTVVLLCDGALDPKAVHDHFERADQVTAGKLHCVQQTISGKKEVINFRAEDSHFKMPETGVSSDQVCEVKTMDGKTIAGHAVTKSEQKSFEDVVYTYDITFSAAVEPKK